MGRRILECAVAEGIDVGSVFDRVELAGEEVAFGSESGKPQALSLAADSGDAISAADVLIDFTVAEACLPNVERAVQLGKAIVIGTTGLTDADNTAIAKAAEKVPVVYAPNMSVGVNLLFKLTRDVSAILGLDYNVEIVEAHHGRKQDSPSGTAKRLGECAADGLGLSYADDTAHGREGLIGARPEREIGMHAVRGGDVAGDHTVHFLGQGERIELTHRATSRDVFARGALRAAKFAADAKPSLYDMQDVLGLK
jgi:4-hydroxy-tetrahydrodipicolinate reductase